MTSRTSAAAAGTRAVRVLLAATVACGASAAFAQTMYRCGSSFQDHPCAGGQAGVAIGMAAARPAARGASAAAPSARCIQQGIAAQKISWSREAGKTEQEQAAAAARGQGDLIAEVYARRGSAVEIRAAIEAECAAREARAAELAAAGGGVPAARIDSPDVALQSPSPAPAPSTRPDNATADAAAQKKATCQALNDAREGILARQRRANTQPVAEQLRQQYRDANDHLRQAGC